MDIRGEMGRIGIQKLNYKNNIKMEHNDNYNNRGSNSNWGNGNTRYNNGGGSRGGNNGQNWNNGPKETADSKYKELVYNSNWIKQEAAAETVAYAEKAGEFMAKNGLTNSKIRSIYGEIKRIQMSEFEKEKSSFFLLKPKVAYALGRDEKNEGLKLFKLIFDNASKDVTDQNSYKNFCNFIEAILAYHKANGGKD